MAYTRAELNYSPGCNVSSPLSFTELEAYAPSAHEQWNIQYPVEDTEHYVFHVVGAPGFYFVVGEFQGPGSTLQPIVYLNGQWYDGEAPNGVESAIANALAPLVVDAHEGHLGAPYNDPT